jgi:hypothetical protein
MRTYNPTDPDDFAYMVMHWLNNQESYSDGIFNTDHGILEIKWGHMKWEYRYIVPVELPESFWEDAKDNQ